MSGFHLCERCHDSLSFHTADGACSLCNFCDQYVPQHGSSHSEGTDMDELIERLKGLSKSWAAQGGRYELDGHDANAQEMYGRAFGVDRAIILVRDYLETRK